MLDRRLWLRADVGVVTDSGGSISTWADLSGLGNDATQSDSASQPQAVASVVNGQPVVRFDGANDVLGLGNVMAGATAGEIFIVTRAQNVATARRGLTQFGTAGGHLGGGQLHPPHGLVQLRHHAVEGPGQLFAFNRLDAHPVHVRDVNPTDVLPSAAYHAAEKPSGQFAEYGQRAAIAPQNYSDAQQHAARFGDQRILKGIFPELAGFRRFTFAGRRAFITPMVIGVAVKRE